jgi:hypothetical protein
MEIVLSLESRNLQRLKDVLGKDDLTSRASITYREGSLIGKQGYFCHISGTDEQTKRALEITKDVAKEADPKDKEALIAKIKEEEEKAAEGLGGIFG